MKNIFRSALLASCIALAPAGQALAACGVGTTLWEGSNSFGAKLAAFTTDFWTLKGISTTFEIAGCTERDSIFKSNASIARVHHFASENLDHLAMDMSRGSGEHLDTFAHLIEIEERDFASFRQLTQDHFEALFPHDYTTSGEMVETLGQLMMEHETLVAYVTS
ncbi:MAG: DUF3015 family protein [Deltaproteobacteria bacterium]|nr:DUF3015 family protein [Deltaproteobacteria bacterium]